MKNTFRLSALVLAILLIVSSLSLFSIADDESLTKLTIDAATVTGTPGNGASEGLAQAVDGNKNSKYLTDSVPAEISFALTEPAVVTYYELTSADHAEWDPKAWTLYGSDDGSTWYEIDGQSDQDFMFTPDTNGYTVENSTAYLWYKLVITESHGEAYGFFIAVSEIELFNGTPVDEPVEGIVVDLTTVTGTEGESGQNYYNLFDGDLSTKYLVFRDPDDQIVSVEFKLYNPAVINTYKLTSANDADARDPKDWVFYASENGTDWIELDSRTDEDFPARSTTYTYQIDNEDEFEWFRFDFTANNGTDPWGYNIIQLAEIELLYMEEEYVDDSIVVDLDTVTASAPVSGHEVEYLFDNSTGTKYLTQNTTMFVQFALTTAKAVNAYTFSCANDWASRSPSDWTFYGSEDGETWVKLDERAGETPIALQGDNRYVFDNDVEYLWYKLDVTRNGGNDYTGLSELKLEITDDPATITKQLAIDASTVTGPAGTSGNGIANLTDNSRSTRYLVQNNGEAFNIDFQLVNPAPVNRYAITGSKDHLERTPKTFTFYGSVDGENWVELDSRDLPAKTASDPNFFCGEAYSFENNVVYKYYRLTVNAVSSGNYMGMNEFSVFTESTVEGMDVYVPATVTDLTGIPAATKLKTITVKALEIDDGSAEAIDAAGPVTVYGHALAAGGGLEEAFAGRENVTFVNLLSVEKIVTEDEGRKATTIISIKSEDVDYESMTLTVCFKSGGEVVKSKTVTINNVYKTVRGYASVNPSTAEAQGYDLIDAAYVAALTIKNIAAGTEFDVEAVLNATVKDAEGNDVEVASDCFSGTVYFPEA